MSRKLSIFYSTLTVLLLFYGTRFDYMSSDSFTLERFKNLSHRMYLIWKGERFYNERHLIEQPPSLKRPPKPNWFKKKSLKGKVAVA